MRDKGCRVAMRYKYANNWDNVDADAKDGLTQERQARRTGKCRSRP